MTCPLSITSGMCCAPASTMAFQAAARASSAGSAACCVSTPRSRQQNEARSFRRRLSLSSSCSRASAAFAPSTPSSAGKVNVIRSVVPNSFCSSSNCPPSSSGELIAAGPRNTFSDITWRFAQRVNGRIRDLREALLAVIPQRPAESGHRSRRRVVAHAPDRFLSLFHQRLEKQAELIFAPAQSRHGLLRARVWSREMALSVGSHEHSRHGGDGADSLRAAAANLWGGQTHRSRDSTAELLPAPGAAVSAISLPCRSAIPTSEPTTSNPSVVRV